MTTLPSDPDTTMQADGELRALDILAKLANRASCRDFDGSPMSLKPWKISCGMASRPRHPATSKTGISSSSRIMTESGWLMTFLVATITLSNARH